MYVCISFNSFWGVDRPLGSSAYAACPVLIMIIWLYDYEEVLPLVHEDIKRTEEENLQEVRAWHRFDLRNKPAAIHLLYFRDSLSSS